jgi:F-type H+-transporting ATPase subunit delta
MAVSRAAARYVKSLLDLAVEKNALDQVHQDMQSFAKVCDQNRDFALMLRNPIIRHEKKREILEKIFTGIVHALSMEFLDIITRKNREPLLHEISTEFHLAYNQYKNIGQASITTAFTLDAALRAEFEKIAQGIIDKKQVELKEKVDKDMIGGFILNVGDRQIDASIKNKLNALRLRFSENPYVKEY